MEIPSNIFIFFVKSYTDTGPIWVPCGFSSVGLPKKYPYIPLFIFHIKSGFFNNLGTLISLSEQTGLKTIKYCIFVKQLYQHRTHMGPTWACLYGLVHVTPTWDPYG